MIISLEVAYGAVLLLWILWTMALMTRRIRILQSQLEETRRDLGVLSDALEIVNDSMQSKARGLVAKDDAIAALVSTPETP